MTTHTPPRARWTSAPAYRPGGRRPRIQSQEAVCPTLGVLVPASDWIRMKTTLTVLVVTVAVALIWVLGREPRERVSPAPPTAATEEVEATPSELDAVEAAHELTQSRMPRTEIDEGSIGQAAGTRLEPATAGTLVVLVVAEESGAPLPDIGLSVQVMEGHGRTEVDWVGAVEGEGRTSTRIRVLGRSRSRGARCT